MSNRAKFLYVCIVPVALVCSWSAQARADRATTLLSTARDSLLVKAIYGTPRRIVSDVAPSGAVGVNRAFEEGRGAGWYIESQRYGGDLVQAGIGSESDDVVREGLRILDWGFARQGADGSFPGTGDAFHSTSLFVEAAARACLLLKQSGHHEYTDHAAGYLSKLRNAARWLTEPDISRRGRKNSAPYTHRRWILAAALGESAEACGDEKLFRTAIEYARDGCDMQTAEGMNPEKGGEDASYQGLGMLMAARYYCVCKDTSTRVAVQNMLLHGFKWEMSRIDSQGNISIEGSTRTGREAGRDGSIKTIDYKAIIQSFLFGDLILGNAEYREIAERIARARKWIK